MLSSPPLKSTINGKETNKSYIRPSLESPSTLSSISTDIPQIEYNPNSPKMSPKNNFSLKQNDYTDPNRIRTPTNENITKPIVSNDQRSMPTTAIKSVRLQSPTEINNHFIDKMSAPPRIFLALFDYDPEAMSPNQNSEEELPFKQGQIIKVKIIETDEKIQ